MGWGDGGTEGAAECDRKNSVVVSSPLSCCCVVALYRRAGSCVSHPSRQKGNHSVFLLVTDSSTTFRQIEQLASRVWQGRMNSGTSAVACVEPNTINKYGVFVFERRDISGHV